MSWRPWKAKTVDLSQKVEVKVGEYTTVSVQCRACSKESPKRAGMYALFGHLESAGWTNYPDGSGKLAYNCPDCAAKTRPTDVGDKTEARLVKKLEAKLVAAEKERDEANTRAARYAESSDRFFGAQFEQNKKNAALEAELRKAKDELARSQSDFDAAHVQIREQLKEMHALREELADYKRRCAEYNEGLRADSGSIVALIEEGRRLAADREAALKDAEHAKEAIPILQQKLRDALDDVRELRAQIPIGNEQWNGMVKTIEHLKAQLVTGEADRKALVADRDRVIAQRDRATAQAEGFHLQIVDHREAKAEDDKVRDNLITEHARLEREVERIREAVANQHNDRGETEKQLVTVNERLREALDAAAKERNLLKGRAERAEARVVEVETDLLARIGRMGKAKYEMSVELERATKRGDALQDRIRLVNGIVPKVKRFAKAATHSPHCDDPGPPGPRSPCTCGLDELHKALQEAGV